MKTENPPISVAEVLEIVPSEDSWVNDGFKAVVRSITAPPANAQKKYWRCVLADAVGSATIKMTVYAYPKFAEGDLIEVVGSGIKRKEYNGSAEVGIGKTTEIHVLGRSAHHEEQKERAENLQPAVDGSKQHIHGQTVGMGIKEGLALVKHYNPELKPDTSAFWAKVHQYASSAVRLGNAIEHGNLTPPLSTPKAAAAPAEEAPQGGRADPPKGTNRKPPAGENGEAFPRTGVKNDDEDVPF